MADQPIDHVFRSPLPWRLNNVRTECGLPAVNHPTITREALLARVKELGRQRAAFVTCMTCWETVSRHKTWEQDPVDALRREVMGWRRDDQLRDELRGLAALVEAHREEFDDYMTGLADTTSLDARREQRRMTVRRPRSVS